MMRNILCKSRTLRPAMSTSFSYLYQPKRQKSAYTPRKKHTLTSTEWIQVSGIPPLSSLDELLTDIERIIKTELRTGIVDLDAAEALVYDQVEKQQEVSELNNGEEEYTSEITFTPPTALPLWDPSNYKERELPNHMVIEAHLKLSTLYREAGWYLRFPNRSCAHAIISHVNEATKIKTAYERKVKNMRKKDALAEKKEWTSSNKRKKDRSTDNNYYKLMDDFSWMDYETRPLRCGWKEVLVRPFNVTSKEFISNLDWIDDTVVRIENCPAESTVDDMRYFLQQYNLDDDSIIFTDHDNDDDEEDDDLNQNKGIKFSKDPRREGVTLVVSGSKDRSKIRQESTSDNLTLTTTNTFLAKFASAADARCAVREKQNAEFMGKKLRLAQFPCQIIH